MIINTKFKRSVDNAFDTGDCKAIVKLLSNEKHRSSVNQFFMDGLLQKACEHTNLDIVKALLTDQSLILNAKANTIDHYPLLYACGHGSLPIVEYLLCSHDLVEHADVTQHGDMALIKACNSRNLQLIKFLLTSSQLKSHVNIHAQSGQTGEAVLHRYYNSDSDIPPQEVIEILDYLLFSPELKEHINIHANRDGLFKSAFIKKLDEILEYLVMKCDIEKSPTIEKYINDSNPSGFDKILSMFERRDLNKHLNNGLAVKNNKNRIKV